MGATGAMLPFQGCLVTLRKFSSIQSKVKINTRALARTKENNKTTLAKQKAETEFMAGMRESRPDGQINLCSLMHCGKTTGPNRGKCGERPCKGVESPYKALYTFGSLVLTDGCISFEAVCCGFSHLSVMFLLLQYFPQSLLFLKPIGLPLAKNWDSNLLLQNRITKCVEFKLKSPNAEQQQASDVITEELNIMFP